MESKDSLIDGKLAIKVRYIFANMFLLAKKDIYLWVYFGISAIITLIITWLFRSEKSQINTISSESIASFSGLVAACFFTSTWLVANKKHGQYSLLRLKNASLASVFIGLIIFAEGAIINSSVEENMKNYKHEQEIQKNKRMTAIKKMANSIEITKIRVINNHKFSSFAFKKCLDSVIIIDSSNIPGVELKDLVADIIRYWPLTERKIIYHWKSEIPHYKYTIRTVNGRTKIFTDSLPTNAKESLCKEELGHIWLIPKSINYSELEACIRTASEDVDVSKSTEFHEKTEKISVSPIIIYDSGKPKLLSISDNGQSADAYVINYNSIY